MMIDVCIITDNIIKYDIREKNNSPYKYKN